MFVVGRDLEIINNRFKYNERVLTKVFSVSLRKNLNTFSLYSVTPGCRLFFVLQKVESLRPI